MNIVLKEWNDILGVRDLSLAEEVINYLSKPVFVVYCNTGKGTCGAIKQGVNKIFREEKDAINYVYDKLRDNKCYRATDDEALEELALTFVHETDIDDAY